MIYILLGFVLVIVAWSTADVFVESVDTDQSK